MEGPSCEIRRETEAYCSTTVGNWGISATNLRRVLIPLPPIGEQQQILHRLEELMAICARIEAKVAAAKARSERLLESLLHDALGSSHDAADRDVGERATHA